MLARDCMNALFPQAIHRHFERPKGRRDLTFHGGSRDVQSGRRKIVSEEEQRLVASRIMLSRIHLGNVGAVAMQHGTRLPRVADRNNGQRRSRIPRPQRGAGCRGREKRRKHGNWQNQTGSQDRETHRLFFRHNCDRALIAVRNNAVLPQTVFRSVSDP
jgi:hypothetical protein